ncbi:MAG: hypothetical protein PUP91_25835 [Rhizonema sp. PD37]|nr:hypothetical protein [Rhizonema sp. PD37]
MKIFRYFRQILTSLVLVLVLATTVACSGTVQATPPASLPPGISRSGEYAQLERGNSKVGEDFANWAVRAASGMVQDAYVRDNNKLGVVISPQVRPTEVKQLAKSLVQGFHKNFPNQDLSVLMYAPDKKLILTAQYDTQSNQVEYK